MRRSSSFPEAMHDDAVEADAVADMPSKSPLTRRLAHTFKMRGDSRCVLLQPRHGEPHRGFLERTAHVIDLVLRARMIVVHE